MAEPDSTVQSFSRDAQAEAPATRVSLSRVGVTGVEKVIRVCAKGAPGRVSGPQVRESRGVPEEAPLDVGTDGNGSAAAENLEAGTYHADLECFVDLNPEQAGVHMSRFEEVVNEAIDEVVLHESLRAEGLAAHIAERVRERQGGLRSEVRIAARYPETKPAPVSGIPTQEIYTLFGTAVASEWGTRTLTGVEAQGMTACPCAQGLVEDGAREKLAEHGYTPDQIDEIVSTVPLATHNQRGIGRLYIGRPEESGVDIDARDLLSIVEGSMSSEIYELMKRSDERAVVEKAHANPRFVEDCVREMIRRVIDAYPGLAEDAFVQARQENLETIHRHNVVAERYGLLAEMSGEVAGGAHSRSHTTMRDWLEAPARETAPS